MSNELDEYCKKIGIANYCSKEWISKEDERRANNKRINESGLRIHWIMNHLGEVCTTCGHDSNEQDILRGFVLDIIKAHIMRNNNNA